MNDSPGSSSIQAWLGYGTDIEKGMDEPIVVAEGEGTHVVGAMTAFLSARSCTMRQIGVGLEDLSQGAGLTCITQRIR
jgi:hypothetical protein